LQSENIVFILVRPVYLGNIGSVARVMKNFGFRRLRLVEPPRNYKDAEARKMAVAAFDILKEAEVFPSLSDALKDVTFAVGTTSGQQRENPPVPLRIITSMMAERSDALSAFVFGDERNGLSREELDRCHQVMTIPTSPDFAALNLAQAVAICAYELSTLLEEARTASFPEGARHVLPLQPKHVSSTDSEKSAASDQGARHASPPQPERASPTDSAKSPASTTLEKSAASVPKTYPTGSLDDEIFEQLGALFDNVEFSRSFNRENVLNDLRMFYQRAQPTAREAALLKGALHSINRHLSKTKT
jgi:TrmH family RNA methyltransferase